MSGMTHPREDTPREPPNLLVALAHAERGRRVFPCDPTTKQPAISKKRGGHGFKDATTDPEVIRGWWRRYPDAIVGMPTGARTGVFVLDVDVKDGKVGEDTLAAVLRTFGPLPDTIEAMTATGGRHLYFRHPRDGRLVPNKGARLGTGRETWGRDGYPEVRFEIAPNGQLITPDLDIRGDGGYVILPGSRMRDGRSYDWEGSSDPDEGSELAEAPAWLLALVCVDPSEPATAVGVPGVDPAEPVGEGGRNEFLYRLGCSLRAKGLTEAAIVAALLAENAARCAPPLPESEVVASAKSAASKPPGLSPQYAERAAKRLRGARSADTPQAEGASIGGTPGRPDLRLVGGKDFDPRPVVEIENGRLPQNTDDAAVYLIEGGAEVYQHGNRLVRVGRWEGASSGIERPTGAGVLMDITPEWLVDTMTRLVNFKRFDGRSGEWRKTDAPSKIAKTLLARAGEWPFDHLVGFCDSPTLTLDGRVVSDPGYDKPSGLYLSNPPKIRPIGKVGEDEVADASRALFALFDTFPFSTPADESAAMAMAMTALLRRVLPSAPLGCISASTPGTGKSLFADCLSVLATGRTAPVAAIGKDTEELEKRIDSLVLKGDALTVFDNVDRAVKSDVLCQVTTQAHKSIRVLAQSRIVEAPTNVALYMTGNNLTLIGDLTRRAVLTNLDAGCERPELREFQRDAIAHVLAHRAEGIRNVLIIAKGYIDAGCPKVDAPPFGSFEQWDRMVRRPLMWAGWPDPLGPAGSMREQDHEFGGMVDLLVTWSEIPGKQEATAAELYDMITARVPLMGGDYGPQYPGLQDAAVTVLGAIGKWSPKELGYRLRQWSGRIVSGYRVVRGGKSKQGVKWRVEAMTTAKPA